jgi:recombinational DNA repair protein RecT
MKNNNTKTLVDSNNTLWTMEYDMYDNSVTVVSDKSYTGDYAVLSQYSMDNALGHDIPEAIVNSAMDMVAVDLPRQSTLDYIIDGLAESKRVHA